MMKIQFVKDKMRNTTCVALASILIVLLFTACGGVEQEDIQKEVGYNADTKETIDFENDDTECDSEVKETEISFVSDTPVEEWNVYGNSFANLNKFSNLSGRMTAQGDWVYYYSRGAIYKKQGNESEIFITNAYDAYSLNVVGDWVYYKEGESVYKVRTDGASKEIILENVTSNIFVVGDEICYISKENVSATVYNHFIKIDNVNSLASIYQGDVGERPFVLIGFRPDLGKVFGYYEEYMHKDASGTFAVVEVDYSVRDAKVIMTSTFESYGWSTDDEFFVMMSDDLIVSNAFKKNSSSGENIIQIYSILDQALINEVKHEWHRKIVIANMWNGKIICTPDSNSSKLYAIDARTIKSKFDEEIENFLKEANTYTEIYVLGDYVYYTIAKTGEYYERPIFRIKTDGTEWSQFQW